MPAEPFIDLSSLPEAQSSYLRGFYVGDGWISRRRGVQACDRLGIEYTWSRWKTVSIARASSVALLDSFVGPKT